MQINRDLGNQKLQTATCDVDVAVGTEKKTAHAIRTEMLIANEDVCDKTSFSPSETAGQKL